MDAGTLSNGGAMSRTVVEETRILKRSFKLHAVQRPLRMKRRDGSAAEIDAGTPQDCGAAVG
jgi:hypothetical protein